MARVARVTRRAAVAGGALAVGAAALGTAARRRPNVVLLLADQWRATATGYAGDGNVRTPAIDRLARESVNFGAAISVCPVCTPYRAALLTGRYPTSTGMFMNDLYLPAEETTMAEILGDAGYDTAYIGKWHLDGHGRDAYIPMARRQGWQFWRGAECDHDYLHSHHWSDDPRRREYWQGYDAFAQTTEARSYLRGRRGSGRPFALMVSFGPPHFPHFALPDGYASRFRADEIRLPPNVPPEMADLARREAAGYYAHCEALDRCVGEIAAELDAQGLADDTILVFTSDHGEMMGSQGCEPYTKQVPWDESVRVPLLVRCPRGRPRRVATPIGTPDLLPTLLGLAGVRIPRCVEGHDLSRLVRGEVGEVDRAALYMLVSSFVRQPEFQREYRAIRTRQHTYVRGAGGPWLLYDDAADPHQMRNLVVDPGSAELARALDRRLAAELRRIGDRFEPRERYLERWGYRLADGRTISYAPGAPVQSPQGRGGSA